jgi:hypothetical protein
MISTNLSGNHDRFQWVSLAQHRGTGALRNLRKLARKAIGRIPRSRGASCRDAGGGSYSPKERTTGATPMAGLGPSL